MHSAQFSRRPHRTLTLLAAVAVAGIGLLASPPARAATSGWIEDAGVAYTAPACTITGGGSNLLGDVYRPASPPAGALPAVVLIHGGGFIAGSRAGSALGPMSEELATLGYVVYNIDYCLASNKHSPPVRGYPMQVTDVEDAAKALTGKGFDQGRVDVNKAKVALWGSSAGATLSVLTGVQLGNAGFTPAAAVGWSGGYDFLDFRGGNPHNEQGPRAFLGCDPQTDKSATCQDRSRSASAALNVTAATPPMSLWNSSDELVPITQWQDMKAALSKAGIPYSATELQGTKHATAYVQTAFCPTVKFLETYLGPVNGTCVYPPA